MQLCPEGKATGPDMLDKHESQRHLSKGRQTHLTYHTVQCRIMKLDEFQKD